MANDLKRVGLVFKEDGAVDFKKSLQEINLELNKNYNQFKLTQAQWDNSTKSTEKLRAEQEYLKNAYEIQSDKVNTLKMQLSDLENAENKNTTAIKKKRNELTSAEIKLETYNKKLKDIQTQLNNTGKKLEEFGTKIQNNGEKIEKAGKKMSAFSVATGTALLTSAKSAIDFEDAFTGVEKTVDGTKEQMAELKQGIRDLAKQIPSTTTEISAVAEAAGQLGIKTEDILSFTKVMIDLGNSTNLSAEEAASSLSKFANVTKMSAKDYDKLGATIVALGNNFATTEADIVEMATRLAATGELAGLSQSQILSVATAMSSVGIETEAGGSAMSKLLKKIQLATELGGDDLKQFAKVAGMTSKDFKKAFEEDAVSALMAFISGLNDTERNGKSAIAILDDMGLTEVRLSNTILSLANASNVMTDAVKLGNEAWEDNTALTNEANKRYQNLKSKITIAINKLKDIATILGNKLMPSIENVIDKVGQWSDKFAELSDEEVDMIIKIGLIVAAIGPLITITGKLVSTIGGVSKGIGIFIQAIEVMNGNLNTTSSAVNNLAGFMTKLSSPLGTVGVALGTVSLAIGVMATKYNLAIAKTEELRKASEDSLKIYNDTTNAINSNIQAQLNEADNCKILKEELEKIVDENGKIKTGYEARAQVITNELSKSLGTEISITENVIDKYKDLQNEIDNLILKKKSETILSGYQDKWSNAIEKRTQKTQELFDLQIEIENEQNKLDDLNTQLNNDRSGSIARTIKLESDIAAAEKNLQNLKNSAENTKKEINGYLNDINNYNYAAQLVAENTTESLEQLIDSQGRTYEKNGETVNTTFKKLIQEQQYYLDTVEKMQEDALKEGKIIEAEKTRVQISETNSRLLNLVSELKTQTSIVDNNSPDIIDAWKQLAIGSYDIYYDIVSNMDDVLSNKIQEMTGVTLERTPELVNATQKMSQEVLEQIEKDPEFKTIAINNLQSFLNGLEDTELRELLENAGVEDAEKVMEGIKNGNLAEDEGINILQSLYGGLNNSWWKNSLWNTARRIASTLSGLLTIKANVNGNTSALPGHKLGLDYVPKDNYVARLHKGERVLTKEENEAYSNAKKQSFSNRNSFVSQEINYNKMANAMLTALTGCKLTLDEDGFAKIVKNELYEVL